jgi:alkylated DNA repair dioxygenase AlkB
MQCALFGSEPPRFDAALPGVRRLVLAGGAWVEHHPSWLNGHTHVFEALLRQAEWQKQRRVMYEREVDVPRLVARAPEEGEMASLLSQLSSTLSRRYGRLLPNVSLAYYRDGQDSVAFHGDKVGSLKDDCIVATVSVGAPRRFLLKPSPELGAGLKPPSGAGSQSLGFDLGWGDLLVMGGTCQRTWQHAIPKRSHADPRISIMFRPVVPERQGPASAPGGVPSAAATSPAGSAGGGRAAIHRSRSAR